VRLTVPWNSREGMGVTINTIKGQAAYVMRCLGKGHSERIYHNALITAMNHRGIAHRSEVACPIWFMGQCIGMGRADLVIDNFVVEVKANKLPPRETSAQLQKYIHSLSKTEKRRFRGVVINFNQQSGRVEMLDEDCPVESALFKRSLESKNAMSDHPFAKRRKLG
jgi:GxxExxY protein